MFAAAELASGRLGESVRERGDVGIFDLRGVLTRDACDDPMVFRWSQWLEKEAQASHDAYLPPAPMSPPLISMQK